MSTAPALVAGAVLGWASAHAVRRFDGRNGVVAAGWASHALFDFLQGPSDDSRLPGWYAPFCAGYDVACAVLLAV